MICNFALFNSSELVRYSQNVEITENDREIIRNWHARIENQELAGEIKNYLDFYDHILRSLLNYQPEDREFERKTRKGRRVEFCIVDSEKRPVLLFELKGQDTVLDRRPPGNSITPVEQAHRYAYELGGTWYVVSNYVDFWLFNYHKPQRCHTICFHDLLTESGEVNDDLLREFKFLFSREQILDKKTLNLLNNRTELFERTFTNEFYNLFNETRLMLIQEFHTNNNLPLDNALHQAQVVLSRLLFCLFAEDEPRGLLEAHILENQIIRPLLNTEVRETQNRIWQNLLNLFEDINKGNTFSGIPAYDGELFVEDLSYLIVRDLLSNPDEYQHIVSTQEILAKLDTKREFLEIFGVELRSALKKYPNLNPIYFNIIRMASYDFSKQIDVDILGHIFELSLLDIENFTDIESVQENAQKRHAEGIFYTPEFVTDYLVRRAIIHFLRQNPRTDTFDKLIEENVQDISALERRVREMKILDPACGSGAFLVKAVDLLTELYEKIHYARVAAGEYIGEKNSRKKPEKLVILDRFFDEIDVRRQIILDNIYGVDINPESVEITKLSLFLKIAKKDLQFPHLGTHIMCGNSIVKDSTIDHKAFGWTTKFASIFQSGGFDIIVGNPPWGADLATVREYLVTEFHQIARGQFDSFAIFLYQNLRDLLKEDGILGYIIPNELCLEDVNEPLRAEIVENDITEMLNLGLDIFEDVTKPSLIFMVRKSAPREDVDILVGLRQEDKMNLKDRQSGIEFLLRTEYYHSRSQSSFKSNDKTKFDIWATEEDRQIKEIIIGNQFRPLRDYMRNGRGIDTNKQGKYLVCPKCSFLNPPFGVGRAGRVQTKPCVNEDCNFSFEREKAREDEEEDLAVKNYQLEFIFSSEDFGILIDKGFDKPGYIGADLQRFHFVRQPRSFKYYGDQLEDPTYARYSKIGWKSPSLYTGEKILFRKVSSGNLPTMMIHDGLLIFNQQIYCFQKKEITSEVSLLFYLAVISSRLFHYYFLKQFTDPDKETLPHFTQTKILMVPVPLPNPSDTQYTKVIALVQNILDGVSRFYDLSSHTFRDFLDGYPPVGYNTFEDLYSKIPPTDRQFFPNEEIINPTYIFKENNEWLEVYGYSNDASVLIARLKIPTFHLRKFLCEFLAATDIPRRGGVFERLQRIRIPFFDRNSDKNREIQEEMVKLYLKNEEGKDTIIMGLESDFNKLDRLIFEYYNIFNPQHQQRIIQTADAHGFRIF